MLYVVTISKEKFSEMKHILYHNQIEVALFKAKIEEIQSPDIRAIAKDKALKAYDIARRPLIIEHTGLSIEDFSDLPGGLTSIVWDKLGVEKFCDFFGSRKNTRATAQTVVAYCNGRRISLFFGEIRGHISAKPATGTGFHWDSVFVPVGHAVTLAEIGQEAKNQISMRRQALDQFAVEWRKELRDESL